MARRGFFAELQYQAQQAEKQRKQQEAAAYRAQVARARELERLVKAAERAQVAATRASAAEQKAAQREAARRLAEARMAEVETMNQALADTLAEIDGMLAATLDVDDYVDLEELKITKVEHPAFQPGSLAIPVQAPTEPTLPAEPAYVEPPAPGALAAAFGARKKHQQAVEAAKQQHQQAMIRWRQEVEKTRAAHQAAVNRHLDAETERLAKLAAAEAAYEAECQQREADAGQQNQELAALINGLAFDVEDAIQEYVGIVLSNSVYPDAFPVTHQHEFSVQTRELTLTVIVPEPSGLPSVKEYRYVKSKDEIASSNLPVKAHKERYAGAVWQVAVRSLHEIFEADRAGKIHSIALTVGVDRLSPATGRPETVPLVTVAADRETFANFDLANVVPHATLTLLGAALSKSPYDLAPADTSRGVRVRGQG